MRLASKCIHSGSHPDAATGAINTPVFNSSAYCYLGHDATPYPRYFNTPNQEAVARKLCDLEEAEDGLVFSSGMAAISSTILGLLGCGEHVVFQDEIYGGAHAFAVNELHRFGIEHSFSGKQPEDFRSALRPTTRLVYIETPSNPLLGIVDIRSVVELAHSAGALVAIDNTFASPVGQTPLTLGVDVSLHSGTKYLGGHSDLCCGAALTSRTLADKIRRTALSLGGSLNAESCYLLERSLKTLALRVERQSRNAMALAEHLSQAKGVTRVHYPGLASHPGQAIARAQMLEFGGMLAFELAGDKKDVLTFLRRLRLVKPALSLGGVETTICTPSTTSHRKMTEEARQRLGISDNLLRLSVGIEDVADLQDDFDQALDGH